jgi:molybdopterin-guanine dinucleotide biosynthesis protein A
LKTGCIILAGGKGRRFGRDKTWVELKGKSLLQHAVSNVEFLGSEIIIVKAPEAEIPPVSAGVNIKVVQDSVGGKGPLVGMLAGLENSQYHFNLVVACDMPLINQGLINYMAEMATGYDIVVPRKGQYFESLRAIYSRDCIPEIKQVLSRNILKVDELFKKMRTRFITAEEIERFDPDYLSFLNINTPDDFKKAEEFIV